MGNVTLFINALRRMPCKYEMIMTSQAKLVLILNSYLHSQRRRYLKRLWMNLTTRLVVHVLATMMRKITRFINTVAFVNRREKVDGFWATKSKGVGLTVCAISL